MSDLEKSNLDITNSDILSSVDRLIDFLSDETFDLEQLLHLWHGHDSSQWGLTPKLYRLFGKKVLRFAEPLIAYDILEEGLSFWPDDIRLKQLYCLTLARLNMPERAEEILNILYQQGNIDLETVGLLGRVHKDMWLNKKINSDRIYHINKSIKFYLKAYEDFGGIWGGINLATILYLSGQANQAQKVAKVVKRDAFKELDNKNLDSENLYWSMATLAEASIILNDFDEALHWYVKSRKEAKDRYGDISTTWRHVELLNLKSKFLPEKLNSLKKCFDFPNVIVFSGHMIDNSDRLEERFPEHIADDVKNIIYNKLKNIENIITYSSLACGADILFVETVLKLGGKVNIVLPCPEDLFAKTSVGLNTKWKERFDLIMASSINKIILNNNSEFINEISYKYSNKIMYGLARIQQRRLNGEFNTMAVWHSYDKGKTGGTAETIHHWREKGHGVEIIDLKEILDNKNKTHNIKNRKISLFDTGEFSKLNMKYQQKIMAIMFADTVNYSQLKDNEFPLFEQFVLGMAKELLEEGNYTTVSENTWGDALFLVFPLIRDAGLFCLEFTEKINSTNWIDKGFSSNLQMRFALHAGIVYEMKSAITNNITYNGINVCRAARIEGVTPPGEVFASMEFSTLAEAEHISDFTCSYVGKRSMPKKFGVFPTYHVKRNG